MKTYLMNKIILFLLIYCLLYGSSCITQIAYYSHTTDLNSNPWFLNETSTQFPKLTGINSNGSINNTNEYLMHLLRNSCEIPCWWGVSPGKTKVQDFISLLDKFRIISKSYEYANNEGSIWINVPSKDPSIEISLIIMFTSNDKTIIDTIYIRPYLLNKYENEDYKNSEYFELFNRFTINHIFDHYGIPENIKFDAYNAEGFEDPGEAKVILEYKKRGVIVSYYSDPILEKHSLKMCPSNAYIEILLFPTDTYKNTIKMKEILSIIENGNEVDITQASNQTYESIVRNFISEPSSCFITPLDMWPTPQ